MSAPVIVIGSGAGGAVTALELARGGADVLVLEEGFPPPDQRLDVLGAMERLYRRRGMTPIMGRVPVGFVEGCCLGGSTEINSGFWHRTPRETLLRWRASWDLDGAGPEDLEPHWTWAEELLEVGLAPGPLPPSTQAFARGIAKMGWTAQEVPRVGARREAGPGPAAVSRMGMSRALWPQAFAKGVRVLTGCRARLLILRGDRVEGVLASLEGADGTSELVRLDASHVFVCAGPTQTPALLQRSGVRLHVGDSLRVHPMLKVAAWFDEPVHALDGSLPVLQVKEFWPEITLGGAFFSPGHLAMLLSDTTADPAAGMEDLDRVAMYYVGVKGSGRGTVRPSAVGEDAALIRYTLSTEDELNINRGLVRLCLVLLAAGARTVRPAVHGLPAITSELEATRLLDEPVSGARMSLTTVHAFSTCPIGERADLCAADSLGKLRGYANLYVNDASMLPGSPGVNPQGTIMALARRNALAFLAGRA